jgi:hypothetical protein
MSLEGKNKMPLCSSRKSGFGEGWAADIILRGNEFNPVF